MRLAAMTRPPRPSSHRGRRFTRIPPPRAGAPSSGASRTPRRGAGRTAHEPPGATNPGTGPPRGGRGVGRLGRGRAGRAGLGATAPRWGRPRAAKGARWLLRARRGCEEGEAELPDLHLVAAAERHSRVDPAPLEVGAVQAA